MKDSSRPQLTLKTSSVYLKNVGVGDTIRVVRHDRKLDYETRVFEITINRLNNKSTDIKLGDRTSQSNEAKIQSAADRAVEEFVEGNFNDFIQNLPDFLPTADGFNNNWYSNEDPTVKHPKKVMIGDIWYKPDPEHEGYKIMLRWTGEMWEEILRTYNAERLKEEIAAEMAELDGKMKDLDTELKSKIADLLSKAGVAESTAEEAKRLAEQAHIDLAEERERSNSSIQNALSEARRLDQEERKATERAILTAKNGAVGEATNLLNAAKRALENDLSSANRLILETKRTLESQVSGVSTELTKTNDTIKTLAKKTDVDRFNQRLSSAETSITQQAGQIALKANQQTVDSLSNRVQSAESSITQQGNQIALKANTSDVNALKNRVSTAESSLTVQAGQIAAKANKSDVDNMGRRITTAEASLTAQAGEIAQRVRKSDFDRETGRLSNVEASVRNLGDRVTTEISRVETKIPEGYGGANLILEGARQVEPGNYWRGTVLRKHGYYHNREKYLFELNTTSPDEVLASSNRFKVKRNTKYSLSFWTYSGGNMKSFDVFFLARKKDETQNFTSANKIINGKGPSPHKAEYVTVTFDSGDNDEGYIRFDNNGSKDGRVAILGFGEVMLVEGVTPARYSPAPEDTLQEIQSVKTNITQTAEGVTQLSTKVEQNKDKLTQQETQVNQLIGEVSSKVSKTEYDNLKRTVDSQTTQLRQTTESIAIKADKTTVATVQTLANQAKAESASAKTEASSATRSANEAKATATSAETKANEAKGTAGTALTNANQAKTNAEAADRGSRDAVTKAVAAVAKANGADEKAAEAIRKAGANQESIRQTKADLTVVSNEVRTKVSQVDFNGATQRLATAETTISTLAGQINTKLSRTEVNSIVDGKGYQTANQVNSIINGKGYQTASQVESAITAKQYVNQTTLTNTISQSERGLLSRITQVETKIPEGYSGANLILEGARQGPGEYWRGTTLLKHSFYHNGEKYLFQHNTDKPNEIFSMSNRFKVKRNTKYSLSFWTFSSGNMKSFDVFFLSRKKGETKDFVSINKIIDSKSPSPDRAEYVTVTFDSGENDEGYIRFDNNGSKNGQVAIFAFGEVMLVEGKTPARYSPAPEELATTVALHEVRDTVDSHTRTLTAQGRSISQFTQTADGIVSRVSNIESNSNRLDNRLNFVEGAAQSVTSQVSQLAGSWAVRNLTSSGTVLSQLNLNKDGSVKIDGKLVQITGQTYIQDGVISSAKIGNLDAGKITTGTLNAARVNLINLDASKITTGSLDARFIRGGQLTSLNGATMFDLQSGTLNFQQNTPSIRRLQNGYGNQFLKFETGGFTFDGRTGYRTNKTLLGSTRGGAENAEAGDFAGLRIWNGQAAGQSADMIDIIADKVVFQDSAQGSTRSVWILETYTGSGDLHFYGNAENGKRHHLGIGSRKFQSGHFVSGYFDELYLIGNGGYIRVAQMLKDLALKMGYTGNDGWAKRIS